MSSLVPRESSDRRSIAVGSWTLLTLGTSLIQSDMPVEVRSCLIVASSLISSGALLTFCWGHATEKIVATRHVAIAVLVSLLIPAVWAVALNQESTAPSKIIMAIIATIPVVITTLSIVARYSSFTSPTRGKTARPSDTRPTLHSCPVVTELESDLETEIDEELEELDDDLDAASIRMESDSVDTAPDVTQWLTRSLTVDGEVIQGGLRLEFSAGQRDATIHVSFCPPFSTVPVVTTEDLDGVGLEIRVAATFSYGARLTIRREGKSVTGDPLGVQANRIGFVAIAAPHKKVA